MSRRWVVVALGALVMVAFGCYVRGGISARFAPDLIGNVTGGHLVATNPSHLYDVDAQHAWQTVLTQKPLFLDVYVSPPHTALLFLPFAAMPFAWASVAFTVLSLAAFALALFLARPLLPDERAFAFATLAFAASEPVAETILCGQTSALFLLVWVAGVRLSLARRDFASGVVLGLGLLKPQLFVVVPLVLIAARKWRALGGFVASAVALLGAGAIVAGPRSYVAWVELLRGPGYANVRAANQFHMSSVEATARGLLPDTAVWPVVIHMVVALVLIVAIMTRRQASERTWAAAIVATLIAAPHLIVYDVVLLLLPALVLAPELPSNRKARIALTLAFAFAWIMPLLRTLHDAPWPTRALAAPLLPLPLAVLFYLSLRKAGPATSGSTDR